MGACGSIETVRFYDIDGCGVPEVFPNEVNAPQCFFKLIRDGQGKGTAQFEKIVIGTENSGHGMGFADVNGDGRMDIVLKNGWLEQPDDPYTVPWAFHKEFELGRASVPILGHDVNGDGLCDLIVGGALGKAVNAAGDAVANGQKDINTALRDAEDQANKDIAAAKQK